MNKTSGWFWQIIDGDNIPFSNHIEYPSLEDAKKDLLAHWFLIHCPQEGICTQKIDKNHIHACHFKCGKWAEISTLSSISHQFSQLMAFCFILAIIGIVGDWIITNAIPIQSIILFTGIFVFSFVAHWFKFKRK